MSAPPTPDMSRRWRTAFFISVTLCVVITVTAAYAMLDQAVTIDGLRIGYNDTRTAAATLAGLGPQFAPKITRAELLSTLRQQHPAALIAATDSTVALGQLTFRFDASGALRKIDLAYVP